MIHKEAHPLAGQTVKLNDKAKDALQGCVVEGALLRVDDWWDRTAGRSWMACDGNPACLQYAMRTGLSGLPSLDDEVVYGKIDGLGHLVHVSELVEVTS